MSVEITRRDDGARGLYTAEVEGQRAGELSYRHHDGSVTVLHTEALPAFRGRGVAYALVERLAEDARREGFKIVPLCWYARDKLKESADWRDLVKSASQGGDEWTTR